MTIRCGDPPEEGGTGRTRVDGQSCRCVLNGGKCPTHDSSIPLSERNRKAAQAAIKNNPGRLAHLRTIASKGAMATRAKYGDEFFLKLLANAHEPTKPEKWLYNLLDRIGAEYEKQSVWCNGRDYILDAANHKAMWVIEIDGYRKHYTWGKEQGTLEWLEEKIAHLRENWYRVLSLDWDNPQEENEVEVRRFLGV